MAKQAAKAQQSPPADAPELLSQQAVFNELHQLINDLPIEFLPAILTHLAAAQGAVAARLIMQQGTSTHSEPASPLLNADQIGERLQLVKSRVYELIRQGKLPALRIGKHVRMEPDRLEQWISEHRD